MTPNATESRIITNHGPANAKLEQLISDLGHQVTFIEIEHPNGNLLTLGINGVQRIRIMRSDGSSIWTNEITDGKQISQILEGFLSNGEASNNFEWLLDSNSVAVFDHELQDSITTAGVIRRRKRHQETEGQIENLQRVDSQRPTSRIGVSILTLVVCLPIAGLSLWYLDRKTRDTLFPDRKPVEESAYAEAVTKMTATELYRAYSENEI